MKSIKLTIKQKIIFSFLIIIIGTTLSNLSMVYHLVKYSDQYNHIMQRVAKANGLLVLTSESLSSEAWYIMIELKPMEECQLPFMMEKLHQTVEQLQNDTQTKQTATDLVIISRTLNTLQKYVDRLIAQMEGKDLYENKQQTLANIRSIAQLATDTINTYIYGELEYCEEMNGIIQWRVKRLLYFNFIMLTLIICMMLAFLWLIINSITRPIDKLIKITEKVSQGNLNARVKNETRDEMTILSTSFNLMLEKIQKLMDEIRESSDNLKRAELQLLQEQINPHFLYNTLETIIWMTETNDKNKVIELVQALSVFFRTTLSQGKDMITIREELRHIESYLYIQKSRYQDILDYHIEVAEETKDYLIQKLSLQPIVENALYHGIKNKRSLGLIEITSSYTKEGDLMVMVSDDGIGIDEEKLKGIQKAIQEHTYLRKGGFGLPNLDQRIKLHFGKDYGVTIQSEIDQGTIVSLKIKPEIETT